MTIESVNRRGTCGGPHVRDDALVLSRFPNFEPEVIERLRAANWPIVEGPVMRTGATRKIRSVYVCDPDFNLIEISKLA